jgi:hypothetical protein
MIPKEKAIQLIDRFSDQCLLTKNGGKVAALIAIGEMLEILYESPAKNIKELAFCIDVTNEIKKI